VATGARRTLYLLGGDRVGELAEKVVDLAAAGGL
jgi:hypothetical protein